jgi:ABC-type uncharacterized transport system involved in gliding motility auxiliary subunit
MKSFFIRLQLVIISVVLFLTFALMMGIVSHYNHRWDFTREKLYSLAEPTVELLKKLSDKPIEVLAFYPHDDQTKDNLETFLRQCRLQHPKFSYYFYDPDRMPSAAKKYKVQEPYTVVVRYGDLQEKIVGPTEESFANALLRLVKPQKYNVCFVTAHGEPTIGDRDRSGISFFAQALEENNYGIRETMLLGEKTPNECDVFVVAGPKKDFDFKDFEFLKKVFGLGKGILFLIDPMDPGQGKAFEAFLKEFDVVLGENVIIDKMSKLVGGDFLVPLVSQYVEDHPITAKFNKPTFFPVARSVNPATTVTAGVEVVPMALSGSGSWAESNLENLEKGDAAFDPDSDSPGPICLAVAVAKKSDNSAGGRMVVVGDSDFVTNAYFELSGNGSFAVNIAQWLAKDDRFISIRIKEPEFKPLFLTENQRWIFLAALIAGLPGIVIILGAFRVISRRRSL